MLVLAFRRRFARCFATGALLTLTACSSDSHMTQLELAAARARPQQEAAAAEAEAAKLAAREQAALAIESDPPERINEDQFYDLLDYHCGLCHFPPDWPSEGIYDFDDLDRLIEVGKVTPENGAGSRLVLRMLRGDMPPGFSQVPPIPDVAIDLIIDFIDQLPVTDAQEGGE